MKGNYFYLITIGASLLFGCKKSKYLDAKPDQALIILQTIKDYQAVLDNIDVMNSRSPSFGETGSDNYYIINGGLNNRSDGYKNLYTWNDNIYGYSGFNPVDWDFPYITVYYSNIVLDGLAKLNVSTTDQLAYDNVKGSALYFRALRFFQTAQIFAPQYNSLTASSDLSISLKMTADINEKLERATVQKTHDRIIQDLRIAKDLLPITPAYKTRPSRPAVCALLAQVYLTVQKYDSALLYSNECLQLYNSLLDYNSPSVNPSSATPFPYAQNVEIIFQDQMIQNTIVDFMGSQIVRVDSNLYSSYNTNDIRKQAFFKQETVGVSFKGSYNASQYLFTGIATDEVYLTRAECYARLGNTTAAINDLNALLIKRWRTGTFSPLTAVDPNDALSKILTERRKELIFRGLRWIDLRRLNLMGANIILTRILNGVTYTLNPNSLLYTYLIPPSVMSFHTDWQQNPR